MSRLSPIAIAIAMFTLLAPTFAAAGDAKLIRIEPRAYYGATVTVASGVRVFRPLPSASHVIINPNNAPVNVSLKEVNKRVTHVHRHEGSVAEPGYRGSGLYGVGGYAGPFRTSRGRKFKGYRGVSRQGRRYGRVRGGRRR